MLAQSASSLAIASGDSSYSPNSLGKPALGWAETCASEILDNSAIYWRNSLAPNAQLKPNEIGFTCFNEFQKAATVWPDKVLPEASVIVPEIITGNL